MRVQWSSFGLFLCLTFNMSTYRDKVWACLRAGLVGSPDIRQSLSFFRLLPWNCVFWGFFVCFFFSPECLSDSRETSANFLWCQRCDEQNHRAPRCVCFRSCHCLTLRTETTRNWCIRLHFWSREAQQDNVQQAGLNTWLFQK